VCANTVYEGKNAVTCGLSAGGSGARRGVWCSRHIAWCAAATLVLAGGPIGRAQPAPVAVQSEPADDLAPPSPEATMAAFRHARAALVGEDPGPLPELRSGGAALTLRLDGSIVARGQSFDTTRALELALATAREDLARRMPPAVDVVGEAARRNELARATLSLELAGPLIPVAFRTFAEADLSMAPGLDGAAVRLGERVEGGFPTTALLSGKLGGEMLGAAISGLLGDASVVLPNTADGELGAIARQRGLTCYRFRTTHVAQHSAGLAPSFLHRGMRVVRAADVTTGALHELADRMAQSLIARTIIDEARLYPGGTYNPVTGRTEPATASPQVRALAGYALAVYARTTRDRTGAFSSIASSRDILRTLLRPQRDEPLVWDDPGAAAAVLLSVRELGLADPDAPVLDAESLLKVDRAVAESHTSQGGWSPKVAPEDRAIVACALAARAAEALDLHRASFHAQANSAVRSLYRDTPPEKLTLHMPWLVRAELLLAGEKGEIGAAPALRDFRSVLWKHQLAPSEDPERVDLAGGIVFTGGLNPYPMWTTAKPLCATAQMLGDPRLTDTDELMPELSRLAAALRFVRQLTTDEYSAFLSVERARAIGGVRSAAWDPKQPPEATVYSLVAVCESLRAMAEVESRFKSLQNKELK